MKELNSNAMNVEKLDVSSITNTLSFFKQKSIQVFLPSKKRNFNASLCQKLVTFTKDL